MTLMRNLPLLRVFWECDILGAVTLEAMHILLAANERLTVENILLRGQVE